MRIGIDIDGVLADLVNPLMTHYNSKYATSFRYADVVGELTEVWNKPPTETGQIIRDFFATPHVINLEPIHGSREVISALSREHELRIITHRSPHMEQSTKQWLSIHYGDAFTSISFGGNHALHGHPNAKLELGKKYEIDWLIEDTYSIARECAENGMNVLLLHHPWNANRPEHANITRVHSWNEIYQTIQTKNVN